MQPWQDFWTIALLLAGSGFALITVVVIFKGSKDMRAMLRGLKARLGDERIH